MEYAVLLYFEAVFESRVSALGQTLVANGVRSILSESGFRPHVSLAILPEDPPDGLEDSLRTFARQAKPLSVVLGSVGVFSALERKGKGVVYLAPVPTLEILGFHGRFYRALRDLNIAVAEYYEPGNWIPHCTVAIDLPAREVVTAVEVCRNSDVLNRPAHLAEIAVVEFQPMRKLFSRRLGE